MQKTAKVIKIGSRNSALALKQTEIFTNIAGYQQNQFEIIGIESSGDKTTGLLRDQGGKGLFAKELHESLLNGQIDMAVHSLKDLDTFLPKGIKIACYLKRNDPRDILITKTPINEPINKSKMRIGTSSLRREKQLIFRYPNWRIKNLRGNILKRFELLDSDLYDGIILSLAGLKRLGLWENGQLHLQRNFISHVLPTYPFVPAPGQGIIAITTRDNDNRFKKQFAKANCLETMKAACIEREFLKEMALTCHDPIGVYAQIFNEQKEFCLNISYYDALATPFEISIDGPLVHSQELILNTVNFMNRACEFRKSL